MFDTTRTIYLHSERLEQFLNRMLFQLIPEGFSDLITLEQSEFKLVLRNMQEKLENR